MAALVLMARTMGIRGVALAWLLRIIIDSGLLSIFSWRLLRQNHFVITTLPMLVAGGVAVLTAAAFLNGLLIKILFSVAACVLVTGGMWRWMLTPREKIAVRSGITR
jgi:hypothetical protein